MRSKKTAKNILFTLLQQIIKIICGFVVPKLILHSYGSAVNGLIVSITQFLGYITLLDAGFGPVVKSLLYKPIAKKDNKQIERILQSTQKFFRKIAAIFILYIIALCIFYPSVTSSTFDTYFTATLIIIISISLFAEYFFGITYSIFLNAIQKKYIVSLLEIVTTAINTLIIFVLIQFNTSIHIVKLASCIIFILKPILQNLYVAKTYHLSINNKNIKEYKIQQKWDGLAQHIAAVIHNNTDIIVLTIFCDIISVSVYAIYSMVLKVVKNILQSLNTSVEAAFGNMLAKKEHQTLNQKFRVYELFFHTICTILFSCTIVLITPFISVYTKNITDANYILPIFGILLTISEFFWALRLPYHSLTLAAGHFKETMVGAWLEAIINILISIILVFHFGIIGVTIGTIIAMGIRTAELVFHTSKYILQRNNIESFFWICLAISEVVVVSYLGYYFFGSLCTSYAEWLIRACGMLFVTCLTIIPVNVLLHKKQTEELYQMVRCLFYHNKNINKEKI